MKERRKSWLWLVATLVAILILAVLVFIAAKTPRGPLAQMELADGRILQVEAVTYGTTHRIGQGSLVHERLGPWLPGKLKSFFAPKTPENTIELDQPALVVWVNAIDPATGTNVDCQRIRVEFVDGHGDPFAESTRHWFGGPNFWRVGHVFPSYPRDERQLTFRVTPWRKGKDVPVTTKLANPRLSKPANWSGEPLPLSKSVGPVEIALTGLTLHTNDYKYYQAASIYYEPAWELRERGQPAAGWSEPEWIAEDPTGNRGQFLCPNWPALRFSATVYPSATNLETAVLVATLPQTDLTTLSNRTWWNLTFDSGANKILSMGICPPGTQVFSEGSFDTNGPPMGPVRGGAPSGWTSQRQQINPLKLKTWHGHYTPHPTIYLRVGESDGPDRWAVRLRDESGRYWIAEPEPQGVRDGVYPFLLNVPSDVTNVTPEIVRLKPVEAEFVVKTLAKE